MSGTYGYNPSTDYQALINEAIAKNDYARAAIYEQQRNEKIAGEGLDMAQSSLYANWLPGSYTGQGYVNPYQELLDQAIGRLTDQSAFKKAYLREADRTMEDTLAQYSTMTGGIPSTQAVAAASQAADYQKSKLAETLQQQQAQNVNLLLSAGQAASSDYQARISEALTRWNMLGYADDQVSQILGVAIGTPTTDQSYLNWQQGQQDKSDAYTMAMTLLQAGQMPSADVLAAAGISAEDAQALQQAYTPVYYGGGGGMTGSVEFDPLGGLDQKAYSSLWSSAIEAIGKGDYSGFLGNVAMYEAMGYDTSKLAYGLFNAGYIIPGFNDIPEDPTGGYQSSGELGQPTWPTVPGHKVNTNIKN